MLQYTETFRFDCKRSTLCSSNYFTLIHCNPLLRNGEKIFMQLPSSFIFVAQAAICISTLLFKGNNRYFMSGREGSIFETQIW